MRASVLYLAAAVAVVGAVALAGPGAAATGTSHEDKASAEVARMHWSTGTVKLGGSHGTFAVPDGGRIVADADAHRIDEMINGTTASDVDAYATIRHRSLYLQYSDSGYVTADDWKDVDSAKLLQSMTEATAAENEERAKSGVPAMYVDGWVQKPTFDQARKIVGWVVKLHQSSHPFVNAVALELGRHGYERFTLASDGSDPAGDAAILADAARGYRFDPGFRFSDYVQGDKLAGFGIAALVGTAAGATIAKTVGFGAILLLIKKFFILILAAGAGVIGWFRKIFTGNRMQVGPPQAPPPAA